MEQHEIHMVTGAFGFTGKYIARELLARGCRVATITNSPERKNDLAGKIEVEKFHFDRPERLVESLRDVATLYNTYWVRFNHRGFTHHDAVENTLKLFTAAREAGVKRIVHTSITNPSLDSDLEYFRGKAVLEKALAESGMSYAILRPAVIFGAEDILINNIAWLLRKLPVFPVFGYGSYRIQPIYVQDFARLTVEQGQGCGNSILNAIGPETYSFRQLVEKIGDIIGVSKPIVSVSPKIAYMAGVIISTLVRDVIVTREEIAGLMADLLYVDDAPTGTTRLSRWAMRNRDQLGRKYASELARRTDRQMAYI
jgi:NADH dehydrogenase